MEKERIEYLDVIKAVSIYLVVFCHYVWLPDDSVLGNIIMTLAWGAVPCFFMVTGGLMHTIENFDFRKYYKKILKFYIVFVIWKMIYFVCYDGLLLQFPKHMFFQYLFMFGNLEGIDTGSMWFISAYFFVILFYPLSYYLLHNDSGKILYKYILLLSMFFGIIIPSIDYWGNYIEKIAMIDMPKLTNILQISPLGNYSNVLFYFLWGGVILKNKRLISQKNINKVSVCMIIIGLSGLMLDKYMQTKSVCWMNIYLEDGYQRGFTVIMATGIFLKIKNMDLTRCEKKLGKIVGRNTLGIYYMHYPILFILNHIIDKINLAKYSFGVQIVKTTVALLICTCLTTIMKKIPGLKQIV